MGLDPSPPTSPHFHREREGQEVGYEKEERGEIEKDRWYGS